MTGEKTDFTQGSILRKLCLFMLPVLGALILQAAYGAVDLLVVGRFGSTSGLSAVSTGSQVLNLVTFVVTQLAMAVTVLIARCLGERCPEQIGAVIGGAAVVFALVSALLFAVLVGLARPIAVVMQAPAEAVTLMASYVRPSSSSHITCSRPSSAGWATTARRCCSCWSPVWSMSRGICCSWPGWEWTRPSCAAALPI